MLKPSIQSLIALLAGSILPLAFAPFGYYPIAFISPAILLWLWTKNSPKIAALHGFLFGVGFFGIGVSWIYISIHTYGYTTPLLAGFITSLFIIYLALFPATQGFILSYFYKKNSAIKLLLAFPLTWVVFEYLRGWLLTGFPWLFLGYSQIDSPLRGIAPIFGVYGISLLITFVAGILVMLVRTKNQVTRLSLTAILLGIFFGTNALHKIEWVKLDNKKIKVTLIQGNIPLEMKWQSGQMQNILNIYTRLTSQHWDSKLIVWSEAAIPGSANQAAHFIKQLSATAAKNNSTIITGVIVSQNNKNYNGAITLGKDHLTYLKRHLVPFGEYLPLKNIFGNLLKFFSIPMSDLSSGASQQPPFIVNNINLAPFICYEIIYPSLVLDYFPKAQLLVTISDDSWFGKSIATAQHLEMARMRSLETGRYQLMSTNTGITAIIDQRGQIISQLPNFTRATLTHEIQLISGLTPYVKIWKHY